ncbi:MAG: 2-succinyl-5-enolpyruvyl-6-hydroxy-3-cyclohexene-1-carboxylic-acid synthase [Actinomycetota bacterium]
MDRGVASINVTFAATLVDQWIREGLEAAFIAPGSRSTPMAIALAERPDLRVEVFHDERSASFAALGHGLASGRPAVVVCTSGTAAAHFHAAVIEASLSAVPLLVCTADRPPELWGRGAPQTIDQTRLYGDVVRDFIEPGPPDDLSMDEWRGVARQAWIGATGLQPGPVHLNLSFREPLAGDLAALPAPLEPLEVSEAAPVDHELIDTLADRVRGRRGVIIAGRGGSESTDVLALADALGWPIIADHRSGCRRPDSTQVLHRYDALLRHVPFADSHQPQVVLRLGEIVSSKAVSQWLSRGSATVLAGRPQGRHIDPEDIADLSFDEDGVVAALVPAIGTGGSVDPSWLQLWVEADRRAEAAIASRLAAAPTNEVGIARAVIAGTPVGGSVVVASSMPVRDVEWFGPPRDDIEVISNRGANGIDGTIATAIGVASTGVPTVCLIGDVAFLHDATSLIALAQRHLDLTIVVVDNDGGGIFSFLPQHALLTTERYEQLFGTPHGTDVLAIASAYGIPVEPWPASLAPSGIRVVVTKSNRAENLRLHDELVAAVASTLDDDS